jgi:gag-polyprotein putative aspartyl protease
MRIDGRWLVCDDGVRRPVISGEIRAADGSWEKSEFLVDTGADRTVFSAATLARLALQPLVMPEGLSGVGGMAASVTVETWVRLTREGAGKVMFRAQYAAVTELAALDISVLGRDITRLFAVIVDWPYDVVCLVGQRHRYTIEQG